MPFFPISLPATCQRLLLGASVAAMYCGLAHAGMGLSQIPATADDGPVTLYYPSSDEEQGVQRGRLTLKLAPEGAPAKGNGRLVVISHGSGGSPWVHVRRLG